MLLLELFDRIENVKLIPNAELQKEIASGNIFDTTKYACVFEVDGRTYVAQLGKTPSMVEGAYWFEFYYLDPTTGENVNIMNQNIPALQVYGKAISALRVMLEASNAKVIAMTGAEMRQTDLYRKILKRYGNMIPGYEVDLHHLMIVRKQRHR